MSLPTDQEQELLQLINRLRADPSGEADHLVPGDNPVTGATQDITDALTFFGVDVALFKQQMDALASAAPLAWNTILGDTATAHSALMIQDDSQSHQLPGEADLGTRIQNAGYSFSNVGENIFAFALSPIYAQAGFVVDWGSGTGGMQTPPGHRDNLMNPNFTEIGIATTPENNPATSVGPLVVTEDLGNRFDYAPQIVGVAYDDTNNDGYYTAGEGFGGVTVTASGVPGIFTTTTWSTGGYELAVPQGSYTLTFSGGDLAAPFSQSVTMGTSNVEVDDTVVPCYAAGTLIATASGESRVESLTLGQDIRLARGGLAEVIWIGVRPVDCSRHARPKSVWPVRIRAGALGEGLPRRDLFLSPDHSVFIGNALIPVRYLINGDSIVQVPMESVVYYHVGLRRHDVILAEGLPCESYLDSGAPALRYPEYPARIWEAEGCAPLVVTGPEVEAARRQAA